LVTLALAISPWRLVMSGVDVDQDLGSRVKDYYRHVEDYDWTRAVDSFVGLETFFHRVRCRETLKLINRYRDAGRYIDIGCGTALVTRHLPEQSVGIDLNPRNLRKARGYARASLFILCDAEGSLSVRSESFDIAVCTEMLEHLLHPERALAEIQRVLRPGGRLIGSVPGRSVVWKLRGLSTSRRCFTEEPYHKHYRRAEVQALISQRFELDQLYPTYLGMNWFFVGRRREVGR
jgi:SAM-dependent methyltransferase